MAKKRLTLAQCRFLGDQLELEGFEHLLQESPLRFLEDLVRGYRLQIPFNTVHVAAHLKRHGKISSLPLSEIQSEVYSGRGGSCTINAPFLEDFLRSIGFQAHLAYAFNAAKSLKRDSFHCAVFARDVAKEGTMHYMDVGTPPPCMLVTDVTKLLSWKDGLMRNKDDKGVEISDAATPILRSLQLQYQLLNGKKFISAFHGASEKSLDKDGLLERGIEPRRLSSYINVAKLEADLQKDDDDSLVMMVAKDGIITAILPHLSNEEDGAWLPMHVFPAPWHRFNFDIIRNVMKDPQVPLDVKLGRGGARGVNITGFGRKSGEYINIRNDRLVRCVGSSIQAEKGKLTTTTTTQTTTTTLLAETAPIRTMTKKMESEEEVMAVVSEEFPLLMQHCRDALDMMAQIEGKYL